MAYLVIQIPNHPRQRTMLRGRIVIGRSFGSDIWFDDPRLSRKHCLIEQDDQRWVLTDQKSTNGTYVNSKLVERHSLADGDTIEIGRVKIEFLEGKFVEDRPADPIDATTQAPGSAPISPADATLAGERIFRRPPPVPQPYLTHTQPRDMPSVPLPFTRPPASPIIPNLEDTPAAAKWMVSLMGKLKRS